MNNNLMPYGMGFILDFQDKTSRQVAAVRKQIKGMEGDTKDLAKTFEKQVDKIEQQIAHAKKIGDVSKQAMKIGAAMIAPLALATRESLKTSKNMGDVATLLAGKGYSNDLIDKKLRGFSDQVADVTSDVAVSRDELEESLYGLFSALGEERARSGLDSVAKLALATKGTSEEAVKLMSSLMKTYGDFWGEAIPEAEKFDKIINSVAGTVQAYNTTLPKLAEGMKWVSGPATKMGMAIEESLASVGLVQTLGIQGGRAGTQLGALLRVIPKIKEQVDKAKTSFGVGEQGGIKIGVDTATADATTRTLRAFEKINIQDAAGKMLPLAQILRQVEQALGITPELAKQTAEEVKRLGLEGEAAIEYMKSKLAIGTAEMAATQKVFTDEGSRVLLMMLGQSDALETQTQHLQDVAVGEDMFIQKNRQAASQVQIMKNQIRNLANEIGDNLLPALVGSAHAVRDITGDIREFMREHPTAAKWAIYATGAVGALGVVGGSIGMVISKLYMLKKMHELVALQSSIAMAMETGGTGTAATARTAAFAGGRGIVALLGKGALYAGAAYVGYEAGKFVYKNILRDIMPGINRDEIFADVMQKSIDAQVKLNEWSGGQVRSMGEQIGTAFKGTAFDPGAGTKWGIAAGEAMRKSQMASENVKYSEEEIKNLLALGKSDSAVIQAAIEEARRQSQGVFQVGDLERLRGMTWEQVAEQAAVRINARRQIERMEALGRVGVNDDFIDKITGSPSALARTRQIDEADRTRAIRDAFGRGQGFTQHFHGDVVITADSIDADSFKRELAKRGEDEAVRGAEGKF